MASRKLIVEVVGDSRSLERTFARSSRSARTFGNETTTSLGKVDAAFTRTQRIAAGGFIGGAAVSAAIAGIRQVSAVAAESQQVLGQTRVALESTGKSWAEYGAQIQEAVKQQSRLGFDDEALLRTFSLFARTTDDVNRALQLNNLAMDVARARFIDLEQAAQLVNKAALGQAGALRRLGIAAQTGATPIELLTLLTEKYGGSAEAASDDAATAFERNKVAVENLQESIGTLLLPALERLSDMSAEAAEFAENLSIALGKVGSIKIPEIEIPFIITIGGQSVGDAAGGLLSKLKFTPLNPLFGVTVANAIADQFRDQAEDAQPVLNAQVQNVIDGMMRNAFSPTAGSRAPNLTGATGDIIADRFGNTIDALIERAQGQAAKTIKTGKARIAAEKQAEAVADALEQAQKDAAKKLRQRQERLAKEQQRQFRALGLDPFGNRPPPTISNLVKQLNQLGERDLTENQQGVLRRIRKVLVDPLKKATPETRAAAKGLIDAIRSELDVDKVDKTLLGPLTRTSSLRANKIIQGLGLDETQIKQLRARLSSFNTAGLAVAGTRGPSGQFRGGSITVENHNTIQVDRDVVARNVTISQQKTRRRNPVQKRGSRRGGV